MIQLSPISIAATSQEYLARIVENLCQGYCLTDSVQPSGVVSYSVTGQNTTGTQTIVTINAAVTITYKPKGCNKSVVKQFSEEFEVAFIGAANAVPTISITLQTTIVGVANIKCCNRAYGVSLSTPITINATYAA